MAAPVHDPTSALFEAVRAYAAAYRQGHPPKRVVIVYDDGERDGRPVPPCPCAPAEDRLGEMAENIIEALADGQTLTGQQIADKTGYPYEKDLKACLASLRRQGVLTGARGDVGYALANR